MEIADGKRYDHPNCRRRSLLRRVVRADSAPQEARDARLVQAPEFKVPPVPEYVAVSNLTRSTRLGDRIQVADRGLDGIIGLLGRRSLDPGTGMLIVPTQAVHTIGMKFPLDLVFIDRENKVIGAREDIPPYRFSRFYWRALGVLELPVGTIRETQTTVGDQLKIEDA